MIGPKKIGAELAITTRHSGEYQSFLVPTPGGGFEVTWIRWLSDGVTDVYVQNFTATGAAAGTATLVADGYAAHESPDDQSIALLKDGSTVVTWVQDGANQKSDSFHSVVAEVITSTGHVIKFTVADHAQDPIDLYSSQSVTALSNGNFVVTWQAVNTVNGSTSIKSEIFHLDSANNTVSAVGSAFGLEGKASAHENIQTGFAPSIAALHNGGYAAAWVGSADTTNNAAQLAGPDSIHISVVDNNGHIVRVDTDIAKAVSHADGSTLDHIRPSIAGLDNGNFVVTWQDLVTDPNGNAQSTAIKAELFNSHGQSVGHVLSVDAPAIDGVSEPSIGALKDGGFVITWTDHGGAGNVYNIKGQEFLADGSKVGDAFTANDASLKADGPSNYASSVTGLANGGFVVSWTNGTGHPSAADDTVPKADIHAQMFGSGSIEVTTAGGSHPLADPVKTLGGILEQGHYSHGEDGSFSVTLSDPQGQGLTAVMEGYDLTFDHRTGKVTGGTITDWQIVGHDTEVLAHGTHMALDASAVYAAIDHAGKPQDLLAQYTYDVQALPPQGHDAASSLADAMHAHSGADSIV